MNIQSPRRHEVVFCSVESVLLESFTRFIVGAQKAGKPTILIATQPHLDDIFDSLKYLAISQLYAEYTDQPNNKSGRLNPVNDTRFHTAE